MDDSKRSQLRTRGVVSIETTPGALQEVEKEASNSRQKAKLAVKPDYTISPGGAIRGPREHWTGLPGAALRTLHESRDMRELASRLAGKQAFPTRAAYLFYDVGHFVGLHKDVSYCQLTFIATLDDTQDPLHIYPHHFGMKDPDGLALLVNQVEEGRDQDIREVMTHSKGSFIVLLGSQLPHQRPPVLDTSRMITLCYSCL